MKVRRILGFVLGIIMVGGFLAQMWDLFDKFVGGLKTVAVSFEERATLEFPSFAFCDSRAFRNSTSAELHFGNAEYFNATTFDIDKDVEFGMFWSKEATMNHTVQIIPTILNGYCKFFDIHGSYQVNVDMAIGRVRCFVHNVPSNKKSFHSQNSI